MADIAVTHAPSHAEDHAPARRGYSYELIAIWILWLLNAAWFFPYAVETGLHILRVPSPGG